MGYTIEDVKKLREKTGAAVVDCKTALTESGGDMEKAAEYLRKRAKVISDGRAGRATKEGLIGSYIHANGKVAVLVELKCETDFVARNEIFRELAKNLAMHIAGTPRTPVAVARDGVPAPLVEKEKEIYREQMKLEKKPPQIIEKIVTGKLDKFYQEAVLLEQPFVKEPERKIQQLLDEAVQRTGENITIGRFVRYALGEDEQKA